MSAARKKEALLITDCFAQDMSASKCGLRSVTIFPAHLPRFYPLGTCSDTSNAIFSPLEPYQLDLDLSNADRRGKAGYHRPARCQGSCRTRILDNGAPGRWLEQPAQAAVKLMRRSLTFMPLTCTKPNQTS
jgi:hypothetical protein